MRLHFSPRSPYARKVVVVAHEAGLMAHIDIVETSASPVTVNHDLAAQNPLGKLPCLVTEEEGAIYDSRVICQYLDSRHSGHKLVPHEGPARWVALRREALADGICDASLLARYETVLRPRDRQWQDWIDGQNRKVHRALDRLSGEVESFPGLPDIGQIAIAVALGYRDYRFPEDDWRATRPKLAHWYETFAQRPSMQATRPPEE
jgi:glutathione S-transferase